MMDKCKRNVYTNDRQDLHIFYLLSFRIYSITLYFTTHHGYSHPALSFSSHVFFLKKKNLTLLHKIQIYYKVN